MIRIENEKVAEVSIKLTSMMIIVCCVLYEAYLIILSQTYLNLYYIDTVRSLNYLIVTNANLSAK